MRPRIVFNYAAPPSQSDARTPANRRAGSEHSEKSGRLPDEMIVHRLQAGSARSPENPGDPEMPPTYGGCGQRRTLHPHEMS